jgi:hypothetical protein
MNAIKFPAQPSASIKWFDCKSNDRRARIKKVSSHKHAVVPCFLLESKLQLCAGTVCRCVDLHQSDELFTTVILGIEPRAPRDLYCVTASSQHDVYVCVQSRHRHAGQHRIVHAGKTFVLQNGDTLIHCFPAFVKMWNENNNSCRATSLTVPTGGV